MRQIANMLQNSDFWRYFEEKGKKSVAKKSKKSQKISPKVEEKKLTMHSFFYLIEFPFRLFKNIRILYVAQTVASRNLQVKILDLLLCKIREKWFLNYLLFLQFLPLISIGLKLCIFFSIFAFCINP